MWSLGCVAASLYLGRFLYPGKTEYDMMRYIVETQGHPSDTLLTPGLKTGCFFQYNGNSMNRIWKLKTPDQIFCETGILSRENRFKKVSSLYYILEAQRFSSKTAVDECAEARDRILFRELLLGMLAFDAAKRLSPRQVLEHQFTSMQHMVSRYHLSPYVRSCSEIMDLGQNRETEINKIPKDHPAPSTSSVKRKMADDDNSDHHQFSCPKTKRVRKNSAAPSTSSSSRLFSPSVKRKMADDDDSDRHQLSCPKTQRVKKTSAAPSTSSVKRKMADDDNSDHHQFSCPKTKRVRKNSAAPSTSSSSRLFSPSVKRKMANKDDSDNLRLSRPETQRVRKNSVAPSTSSVKRKMADDYNSDRHQFSCPKTQRVKMFKVQN
ncbi:homeodomain-interacting protein kinase 1-like [Pseudoliparis swirei]|uniref:homeodomain-interacting protein kinase 1-like n=1 Tax=Pseudoliparis swirei TaxID=2059687 RepID=UPI0024BE168E|nr:homeodomain-interacting protein kinase 1-like [Pseudoliparis swirei]